MNHHQDGGPANISTHLASWQKVTLYEDATDALRGAVLMYGLSSMRDLIRTRAIPLAQEEMDTLLFQPVAISEQERIMDAHTNELREAFANGDEKQLQLFDLYADCAHRIHVNDSTCTKDEVILIDFADELAQEELVYAIALDKTTKTIHVNFRGSVTTKDWIQDAKYSLVPMEDPSNADNIIYVHQGFKEYLNGASPKKRHRKAKAQQETKPSAMKVMTGKIIKLLEQYPGYKIQSAGHSLGGALSTLFSFQLAANPDPRLVNPISCVSFASPKVGNRSFAMAFQALERKGHIRCLRVSNHADVIPELPWAGTLSPCFGLCFQRMVTYRHVGMHLLLRPDGKHDVRYPRLYEKPMSLFLSDSYNSITKNADMCMDMASKMVGRDRKRGRKGPVVNHSLTEYWDRLSGNKEILKAKTLNELYLRQQIDFISESSHHLQQKQRGKLKNDKEGATGSITPNIELEHDSNRDT